MSKYETWVPLPDAVKEAVAAITEVATIVEIRRDGGVLVEFDEDNLYDLATRVHELEDRLTSLGDYDEVVSITRPKEVVR